MRMLHRWSVAIPASGMMLARMLLALVASAGSAAAAVDISVRTPQLEIGATGGARAPLPDVILAGYASWGQCDQVREQLSCQDNNCC